MSENETAFARAEFYLCLARAFSTPARPEIFDAARDVLPADLAELGSLCGYPIDAALADYRAAIALVRDPQQLLILYSRLFLVPGDLRPSLNVGVYLDGVVAGGSVTALETCYARCGLGKNNDFHDLPDHLSVQLEFVAWLFAAEARAETEGGDPPPFRATEFLAHFVARWIGPFRADLEAASFRFHLPGNPYRALARLLETAVLAEVGRVPGEAIPAPGVDPEIARLRGQFAGREMTEEDLAIIRARLEADGFPSGHVAIPVEARDRVMGLAAMTPPAPPSHRITLGK
jgi:TorA maturation chaperone TorD